MFLVRHFCSQRRFESVKFFCEYSLYRYDISLVVGCFGWTIKWNGSGRKESWPNRGTIPEFFWRDQRRTQQLRSIQCPGRGYNPSLPKYKPKCYCYTRLLRFIDFESVCFCPAFCWNVNSAPLRNQRPGTRLQCAAHLLPNQWFSHRPFLIGSEDGLSLKFTAYL
jgi:hypothetical protein